MSTDDDSSPIICQIKPLMPEQMFVFQTSHELGLPQGKNSVQFAPMALLHG
ncbi:hypothetical protein SK128_009817 [Halocaridina rubra]|uniref:Uncharacterized protein n=1 Tax=Halocaridina rubra TaxID=373956 RepID=A0AAN8WXL1_HALRR